MNTENHYQETDLGNIAPNPRGEYRQEESYEYLDLVVFEGGSYVCLAENGTTITGISPESGKTTQYWQVITIPGSLTHEYIAMHDRVVNLSEQAEADADEVRAAERNVSGMEENVTKMQEQTRQSAEAAERSKDSAAGYAASADASRQAAEESEQNVNAQVSGFDSHVAEKVREAESDIEAARIAANKAIIAQQEQSVNEVSRVGIEAVSTAQAEAQTATEKAQAASTSEKNAAASEKAAKLSEENATKMAEQVAADKEQVANDRTAVENAKQEMAGSAEQIEKNTQGISELKGDLGVFKNSIVTELNTENFFDNQIGYENGYILSNGTISVVGVYGEYYSTSVAFPLKAGTWSIYGTDKSGTIYTQFNTIYFVDSSDGSVIYLSETNEKITFTAIHDGTIRICVQKQFNEQTWTGLMLVQGEDTYKFIPYKKCTIIKDSVYLSEDNPYEFSDIVHSLPKLPSLLNSFSHYHSVNYFDYRIGKEQGFLRNDGGLNVDGVYGIIYYTSNPIHLSAGTWTLYSTSYQSGMAEAQNIAIRFVDNFDNSIIYNAPGSTEKITFTALHSGILRCSFPEVMGDEGKRIMLVMGENAVKYTPYDEALIIKDTTRINERDMIDIVSLPYQNVLFGKKYVAAGDSYTEWSDAKYIGGEYDGKNVTYDREIRLRNHMSGENRGISGSSMALTKESFSDKDYLDGQAFSNTRYLEIPEDTDILTIAFGINDTGMCDLGQLGDTENTTFYGAWHKVLSYYAQNRPEMKVGIICFQRSDNDFYRAVKKIAKYYGIPLLDFFGSEDTPMYVDGKAYPVDETIKSVHKAYWCGHAHDEEVKESFRGKEYMTIVGDENPGHPGYRAHIDESTIIEDFLRRL